jgi:hypothetical protein
VQFHWAFLSLIGAFSNETVLPENPACQVYFAKNRQVWPALFVNKLSDHFKIFQT